ncbi:MAG: folylpolyglutamate synthase/dihydrofolate synthase family protein [Pelolinea sp.]|nr:folylpolyglutamate synthase/dihydrofolate synthase family protein [Pelolinea sp.]
MVKTYSQALDYIYSFVDYSLTRNLRYSPEKFNLKRMEDFLELLGNPHKSYKVIHVAGTKGKGSTCAMLASILIKNGFRTGFYSSPHMIDFTERIRISEDQISHQEIVEYINLLDPIIKKVPELTTFEIITGLAFKYFADKHVDFAVIEVGMGGRFDATNVVQPEVSVITSISHDHTKVLGKSLKKIAFEKAGIIKNGIPVIVSKQKTSPLEEIIKIAGERNAGVVYAPGVYRTKSGTYSLDGQRFEIQKNGKKLIEVFIPLLGDHQIDNAVTAFACIEELKKRGNEISSDAIISGFQYMRWPGRFEVINKKPVVIIDGAHNLDSFRKLIKTIQKYLPEKQIILIFGVSEDKAVASMLKIIQPLIKTLIITKSQHPRALELYKIKDIAEGLRIPSALEEEIKNAIGEALVRSDESTAIVATGSIFIAGAVKENFKG